MSKRDDILVLEQAIRQSVLGQDDVVRQVLLALLADGHVLLESLPGLAKTRTVKALARHLAADMSRIQFTPDLLPSDITGAEVLHQEAGRNEIRFQPGPLFGNIILADEINRAPAKVQAALLEAMEERQITVAGTTRKMPELFMVLATQNPIEQEGTYPLPEAQMDRFIMKIVLDYPDPDSESRMLKLLRGEAGQQPEDAPALMAQEGAARGLSFSARQPLASILAGQHGSRLRGRERIAAFFAAIVRRNRELAAGNANVDSAGQLNAVLRDTLASASHDSLVCIISDFAGADENTLGLLRRLAAHNDVVATLVYDPLALNLRRTGRPVVTQGELQIELNAGSRQVHKPLSDFFTNRLHGVADMLRRSHLPLLSIDTAGGVAAQVRRELGRHAAGRGR
jgi:MoxR-like ATPase